MKIIFMGTPDFAVPSLKALAESPEHTVSLVVTQPDRPKGRSREPQKSAVKICAESYGIPVFQPEKVRVPEAVSRLQKEQADVIVVAAFGQILPKSILEMTPYGCINVHGSLLPAYRGAAPVQWAVIDGQKESGDTIMQLDEGVDTGDILAQESIELAPDETAGSLYEKLAALGGPLLLKTLDEIAAGTVRRVPQDASKSSYAHMLTKEMGDLDWSRSAAELEHLVRGLNPWPCAFTHWNGKSLKIWMAAASDALPSAGNGLSPSHQSGKEDPGDGRFGRLGSIFTERKAADGTAGLAGTVALVTKDALYVQTGDGFLSLLEVQLEGKKRMPVREFLMGNRIAAGDVLR